MFGQKKQTQEDVVFVTIFDTKTTSYKDPIQAESHATILRALSNNMTNPQMAFDQYVKNAEDFQLFKIGSFDRKTGMITAHQPEHLANLQDIKSMALERERALSAT